MANIDAVIKKCVEDIMREYDTDGNGYLDKNEAKTFVEKTLGEMQADSGASGFSDDDFNACFNEFDKNGDGTIERDELAQFIKKVAGL